jgi:hypothetical protein
MFRVRHRSSPVACVKAVGTQGQSLTCMQYEGMTLTVGSSANILPVLLPSPFLAAKFLTEIKFQIIKHSLLLRNNISYFSLETA